MSIKEHPLWIITGAVAAAAAITFGVIHELRIIPLQERIAELEKTKGPVATQPTSQSNRPGEQAGGVNPPPTGSPTGAR